MSTRFFLLTITIIFTLSACEDRRAEMFEENYKEMLNKLALYDENTYLPVKEWEKILGGPILSEYKNYREVNLKLKPIDMWSISSMSPFALYLTREFSEGFEIEQVRLYKKAVDNLDCQAISNLYLEGFLNLYPFLRSTFEPSDKNKENILSIFNKISYQRFVSLRYCESANMLENSYRFAEDHGFSFPLYKLEVSNHRLSVSDDLPSNGKEASYLERCLAVNSIIRTAITYRYQPAIRKVLNLMKRPDGVRLPPDMAYYLYKLAKQLNMEQVNISSHGQSFYKGLSKKQIRMLDHNLHSDSPPLQWLERGDCSKPWSR